MTVNAQATLKTHASTGSPPNPEDQSQFAVETAHHIDARGREMLQILNEVFDALEQTSDPEIPSCVTNPF